MPAVGEVNFKYSVGWWNYDDYKLLNPRVVDPTNILLQYPTNILESDLRPDVSLTLDSLQLIVQPRLQYLYSWINYTGLNSQGTSQIQFQFSQAYASLNVTDWLALAVGMQNYQWGPAELISPSNSVFHFSPYQRSIVWVEPGRWLGRANFSIGQNWSLIFLDEFAPNQQPSWNAGESFSNTAMGKLEYKTDRGTDYIGVTGGGGLSVRPWIGEYGVWEFADGFSIYVDARQVSGSNAFYPEVLPSGYVQMQQSLLNSNQILGLTVAGFRYESTIDWRLEFLDNEIGYSVADFQNAVAGASEVSPYLAANLNYFLYPGLELYQRHYLYTSLRAPDLGKKKLYTLMARYFVSIDDGSANMTGSVQRLWGDHGMFFLEASYLYGGSNNEINFLFNFEVLGGLRLSL